MDDTSRMAVRCIFIAFIFVPFLVLVQTSPIERTSKRMFTPRSSYSLRSEQQRLRQEPKVPDPQKLERSQNIFKPTADVHIPFQKRSKYQASTDDSELFQSVPENIKNSPFQHINSLSKIPLNVIDIMLSDEIAVNLATFCILYEGRCPEGGIKQVVRDLMTLNRGARCRSLCSFEEQERIYDIVYKLVMGYSTRYPTYWGRVKTKIGHLTQGLI